MALSYSRVSSNPFRLRSWAGVLAVNKPSGVLPQVMISRIRHAILTHETELPPPHSGLTLDYLKSMDSFHEGVLVIGVGPGIVGLPEIASGVFHYKIKGFLGKSTKTFNSWGSELRKMPCGHVNADLISDVLRHKYFERVILPLPPVTLVDDRKRYSKLMRKRVNRFMEEPLITDHQQLVRRPYFISNIELSDFSPPYFSLDVMCKGQLSPYGLVYQLAHDLGTCGLVESSEIVKVANFKLADCLSERQIDNPRVIHTALSQCFSSWNCKLISSRHKRHAKLKEQTQEFQKEVMALPESNVHKRVALGQLMPLMRKGPVAREDVPASAASLQDMVVGVRNMEELKQTVKAMRRADRRETEADIDAGEQRLAAVAGGHAVEERPERDVPVKERRRKLKEYKAGRTDVEHNPERFATFKSRSFATGLQLAGHGNRRPALSSGEPAEADDEHGTIKDRLRKLKQAKDKHDPGFQWKSQYGV